MVFESKVFRMPPRLKGALPRLLSGTACFRNLKRLHKVQPYRECLAAGKDIVDGIWNSAVGSRDTERVHVHYSGVGIPDQRRLPSASLGSEDCIGQCSTEPTLKSPWISLQHKNRLILDIMYTDRH